MNDYSSAGKLTWRGWVWNRLAERVPKLERKNALGVYLVGPQDLDRNIAIKKGFTNYNLVAVDKHLPNVTNVRNQGNLAVQASLQDLLVAWPANWDIHCLNADLCCGLDDNVRVLTAALLISRGVIPGKTIVAINLQRGRDPHSNPVRLGIKQALQDRNFDSLKPFIKKSDEPLIDIVLDQKHRAKQFFSVFLHHMIAAVRKNPGLESTGQYCNTFANHVIDFCNPQFYSYRQSTDSPFMDSVVFTMPPFIKDSYENELREYVDWTKRNPLDELSGKLNALKAVRTMKLKGLSHVHTYHAANS